MKLRRTWALCFVVVAAVGLSGCRRPTATTGTEEIAAVLRRVSEQVDALENELSAVRASQEAEFAVAVREVLRQRVTTLVVSSVEAGVSGRLGDPAQASQVLRSVVHDQVSAYLQQEEARVAAEREQRRREEEQRRREREEAALVRLGQELGLTNDQTRRLVELADRVRVRVREMMESARNSSAAVDIGRLREQAQALRAEIEAELGQIVSSEQLAQLSNRREFGMLRFLEQLAQSSRGPDLPDSSAGAQGSGPGVVRPSPAR